MRVIKRKDDEVEVLRYRDLESGEVFIFAENEYKSDRNERRMKLKNGNYCWLRGDYQVLKDSFADVNTPVIRIQGAFIED